MWRSRAWVVITVVLALVTAIVLLSGYERPQSGVLAVSVAGCLVGAVSVLALRRSQQQRLRFEEALARWSADRAAHEERLRIARELHDLASHGLAVITLRSASAQYVQPDAERLEEQASALRDIEQASRQTTTELRRMLSVLREPGSAPLRPAESFDDLELIADAARGRGVEVNLEVDDSIRGAVSAGLQVTVCAIVREALANTLRHAGPTTSVVRVGREGSAGIVVRIEDCGRRSSFSPVPGAGHGLAGLHERVSALGGQLNYGATERGWILEARFAAESPA